MKSISLINMKGGVGKTTLATNLADCLNRRHGKRVLVLDVDPQFNCTQCLMSPEDYVAHRKAERPTMLDIFDRPRLKASVVGDKEKAGAELSSLTPRSFRKGFDFLPGNLELYRLEMAPGEGRENRLKSYIKAIDAENNYDFVVIDTPPTPSVWMTSALIASDYYLIPVRPDPLSLTGVDLLKGIVADRKENFGLDIECLGLVLTMVRQGTVVLADAERALQADSYWKDKLFGARIPGRVKVAEYQLNNQFMLDMDDSDTKLAITTLTNQILAKLTPP